MAKSRGSSLPSNKTQTNIPTEVKGVSSLMLIVAVLAGVLVLACLTVVICFFKKPSTNVPDVTEKGISKLPQTDKKEFEDS